MRLSAPTNRTFLPALLSIVIGIVLWNTPVGEDISPDVSFWLTAGGGTLLVLGSVFKGI